MSDSPPFAHLFEFRGRYAALAGATAYVGAQDVFSVVPPAPDHALHPKGDLDNAFVLGLEIMIGAGVIGAGMASRRVFRFVRDEDV